MGDLLLTCCIWVQLFGYYAAALTVDWKPWGRRRMTTVSFLMVRIDPLSFISSALMTCSVTSQEMVAQSHSAVSHSEIL